MLSMIRKGTRSITFDAIAKLLPAIEKHSSRTASVTLLIAYLTDETPPSHSDSITIQPIDESGQPIADEYRALSQRWEAKARLQPEFMAMWQGLDLYMHEPDAAAVDARLQHRQPATDIALLSEQPAAYKVTKKPRGSHPHDAMNTEVRQPETKPTTQADQ